MTTILEQLTREGIELDADKRISHIHIISDAGELMGVLGIGDVRFGRRDEYTISNLIPIAILISMGGTPARVEFTSVKGSLLLSSSDIRCNRLGSCDTLYFIPGSLTITFYGESEVVAEDEASDPFSEATNTIGVRYGNADHSSGS